MRKFNTFAAMMPAQLVEATAKIYDTDGKHCPGDIMDACRFGYAIRWCDGSGAAAFQEEETLDAAIEAARKYLASKGWRLGKIEYTNASITEDIVEKYTVKMKSMPGALDEYRRFLRLKMDCISQPWFDPIRSEIDGAVSLANIADLPDDIRNTACDDYLIGFINECTSVKMDYEFVGSYFRGGKWYEIGQAKEKLGLPADCPDVDVANRIVHEVVDAYKNRFARHREKKAKFIEIFNTIAEFMELAINECAATNGQHSIHLATLEAFENIDWYPKQYKQFIHDHRVRLDISGTIRCLSVNRMYCDWSTLDRKHAGSCTLVKVKLSDDIYDSVRLMVLELAKEHVDHVTELHKKYGTIVCGDWRSTQIDAQWLYIRYGIDEKTGNPVFTAGFGPEDVEGIAKARQEDTKGAKFLLNR